ncbi:hypothetical protein EDC96DRAFT_603232 [Choanephora cucurbitarum]|nr:hypothetical protein EDC96DRAFT_603232 [Choanephora cucurbitarum]
MPSQHPISSIQYPVSSIQYPVSSIQYPVSSIQYPVSSIQYPVSNIQYPISNIQYPISSIQLAVIFSSFEIRTNTNTTFSHILPLNYVRIVSFCVASLQSNLLPRHSSFASVPYSPFDTQVSAFVLSNLENPK